MSDALEFMAARVATDPFFLACPLTAFAQSEGLDDAALAARLGCRITDLTRLRLCRAPRPDLTDFRTDITAVATAFGIDPVELAKAVRHGEGLVHLRETSQVATAHPGFLLAARDDDRRPPQEPPTEPPKEEPPP